MDGGVGFLSLYTEILLGTVAFMAIIATLRQTFGEPLTQYQYLIARFFVDMGLLNICILLFNLALFSIISDADLVWTITLRSIFVVGLCYLLYYVRRRFSIRAPRSLPAALVILGYLVVYGAMGVALLQPNLWDYKDFTIIYFCWAFTSLVIVFMVFMGSFINIQLGGEAE